MNTKGTFIPHVEKLHRKRMEEIRLIETDPELDRQLALYWLKNYPEYRKEIRERVSEAARRAEKFANRIDREHQDVDYLGREPEGCG